LIDTIRAVVSIKLDHAVDLLEEDGEVKCNGTSQGWDRDANVTVGEGNCKPQFLCSGGYLLQMVGKISV